jgi:hypothetical protein
LLQQSFQFAFKCKRQIVTIPISSQFKVICFFLTMKIEIEAKNEQYSRFSINCCLSHFSSLPQTTNLLKNSFLSDSHLISPSFFYTFPLVSLFHHRDRFSVKTYPIIQTGKFDFNVASPLASQLWESVGLKMEERDRERERVVCVYAFVEREKHKWKFVSVN